MTVKKLTASALFLSLCYVLPFLSGNIPVVGKMLLLMHIPVMLAGITLGWQYGLFIGLIAPLSRCLFFGSPIIYPDAIVMAFELAAYGVICGIMFKVFKKLNIYIATILSLLIAMISGRIVWGIVKTILLSFANNPFTFKLFLLGGFVNAWPGILLQLILIPILVPLIAKVLKLKK